MNAIELRNEILEDIQKKYRTFGGGEATKSNPLAAALKDAPLQFAAGVNVSDVVLDVMSAVIDNIVDRSNRS